MSARPPADTGAAAASIVDAAVRLLGFIPRLLLIVGAGALLLTATVVGIAPRVWSTANAHEELPVVLPDFDRQSVATEKPQ